MPDALIAITTSPGPGRGSANSRSSSFRSPRKTTPRMVPPSTARPRDRNEERLYSEAGRRSLAGEASRAARLEVAKQRLVPGLDGRLLPRPRRLEALEGRGPAAGAARAARPPAPPGQIYCALGRRAGILGGDPAVRDPSTHRRRLHEALSTWACRRGRAGGRRPYPERVGRRELAGRAAQGRDRPGGEDARGPRAPGRRPGRRAPRARTGDRRGHL